MEPKEFDLLRLCLKTHQSHLMFKNKQQQKNIIYIFMCISFSFFSLPRRHITSNLRYYVLEQGTMHCIYTVTHEIAFNVPPEQENKGKYNKRQETALDTNSFNGEET